MPYLFEPSILQSLNSGALFKDKDITTDPTSRVHKYLLRPLKSTDTEYLGLLKQLTTVGDVTDEEFTARFSEFAARPRTYFIVVLEDVSLQKLVGSATLLVELKMIHKCSKRGHIEDVVVDETYRNQGLGKLLVGVLLEIGRLEGCYKISLDCNSDKVAFYEQNGFKQETVSMCVRLPH